MKRILGISAFFHDSSAVLLEDGKIIAAVQEERFTREKHTEKFPINSIKYCLEAGNIELDELDAIVFYEKPFLKFERLIETYYTFAPKGILSFLKAMPSWLNEKLFLKKTIKDELSKIGFYDRKRTKLLFSEHHLSHAASAFFSSPYNESAILTIDGVGEWTTASIAMGSNNSINILKELHFPHSVGLLYSAFTYFLGFSVNSGEYKLMGLAPYGNPNHCETLRFIDIIKKSLVDIKEDGSIRINQKYFTYATGLKMVRLNKWEHLFGIKCRKAEDEILQSHSNLAFAIQKVTEEIVLKMAQTAKSLTNSTNLCLAGGVALNCVANGVLLRSNIFKNIFIQPASGDAGGALGAALSVNFMYYENPRISDEKNDIMQGAFLGPNFSNRDIEKLNRKTLAEFQHYNDFDELSKNVADLISKGNIVGWFQGRMEFGPRALGNRSILGDARNNEMQKKLNLKIKNREGFRPFAPSVLSEDAHTFFDLSEKSPYMLIVANINNEIKHEVSKDYEDFDFWKKLYVQRSDVPAITHVDFSARVQTVHKETNPKYHQLISDFKTLTGCPLIVNTSFNVRGEPIVCSPEDAYICFMSTDMDYLVINDYLYCKTEQPNWERKDKWKIKFKLD